MFYDYFFSVLVCMLFVCTCGCVCSINEHVSDVYNIVRYTICNRSIHVRTIYMASGYLLAASGPHRASSLKVQYFARSSKYNPDGQRFIYGKPSTHCNIKIENLC